MTYYYKVKAQILNAAKHIFLSNLICYNTWTDPKLNKKIVIIIDIDIMNRYKYYSH